MEEPGKGRQAIDAIREQTAKMQEQTASIQEQTQKMTDAVNSRIDRLEVVLDTNAVTSAQKKRVNQNNVGSL